MYKLIKLPDEDNKFDNSTLTLTSNEVGLADLLTDIEDFLRGCGFRFDGRLDIVDEEE